jgi:hypothetical protein
METVATYGLAFAAGLILMGIIIGALGGNDGPSK